MPSHNQAKEIISAAQLCREPAPQDGRLRPKNRAQKTEYRIPKTVDCRLKSEDWGPKTGDRYSLCVAAAWSPAVVVVVVKVVIIICGSLSGSFANCTTMAIFVCLPSPQRAGGVAGAEEGPRPNRRLETGVRRLATGVAADSDGGPLGALVNWFIKYYIIFLKPPPPPRLPSALFFSSFVFFLYFFFLAFWLLVWGFCN